MYFLLHTEMAVREMAMIPGKWTDFLTTSGNCYSFYLGTILHRQFRIPILFYDHLDNKYTDRKLLFPEMC